MRINLTRLERSGCTVDKRKDSETGDSVIDITFQDGQYLELPTLVNDLKEVGLSEAIAHCLAEDLRIQAHDQCILARIQNTS